MKKQQGLFERDFYDSPQDLVGRSLKTSVGRLKGTRGEGPKTGYHAGQGE